MNKMIEFLDWLQYDTWWASIISFLLIALLAFVPAAPIPLVAGIIGTAYPFPVALCISLGGTVLGSISMFFLCRTTFQKIALKQVQKWQRLDGFFRLLERDDFLAVLIGRLIPIMPSAAINAIAGVANVRFHAFLLATTMGKLPTMIAFTVAGTQFEENRYITGLLIGLYVLAIVLVGSKIRRKWTRG